MTHTTLLNCVLPTVNSQIPKVSAKKGRNWLYTLLKLRSRFGNNTLKFVVVCSENGTAVLKGSAVAGTTIDL